MKIIKILIGLLVIANLAMAANNIEVHINYPSDTVFIGSYNKVEIWIENDDSLLSVSMGYEFTGSIETIMWDTTYGVRPPVAIENDARSSMTWMSSGDGMDNTYLPDSIRIGAVYMPPYYLGLPPRSKRACVSMYFYVPEGESPGQFCIDNVWLPPAVSWYFENRTQGIIPSYQGCPEDDMDNPDCPAVCFPVAAAERQCGDVNGDEHVNLNDPIYILNYMMHQNDFPVNFAFSDVNCDGRVNVADAEFLMEYIFIGGSIPCSNCP